MSRTTCGNEFQLRQFGLKGCHPRRFYTFWFSNSRRPFVIYRTFLLVFHTAWFVATWIKGTRKFYYNLSNWSMLHTFIYVLFAFITAVYGLFQETKARRKAVASASDVVTKEAEANEKIETDKNENAVTLDEESYMRWFHKATWLFHSVAIDTALFVTLIYWIAVFPSEKPEDMQPIIGYGKHAVNFGMLVLDLMLVNFPVRPLHAVYMIVASALYSIYLIVLHALELESAVYGFTNFEKSPALALGVLAASSFVAPWILQGVIYLLHLARVFAARCCCQGPAKIANQKSGDAEAPIYMGMENSTANK